MSALWDEIQSIKATAGVANIYSANTGTYTLNKANANVIVEAYLKNTYTDRQSATHVTHQYVSTKLLKTGESGSTSVLMQAKVGTQAPGVNALTVKHNGSTLTITGSNFQSGRVIEIG